MPYQSDRQLCVSVGYLLVNRFDIIDDTAPAIVTGKMTWLVCVFAVATMIVAVNDTPPCSSGGGEAGVTRGMFSKPMKYLHDLRRRFARPPYLHLNVVTIGRLESDSLVLSHLRPKS